MTTTEDLMAANGLIAAGTVQIHPGLADYEDAKGKIILFVRDMDEGRSLFMGVEMYGEISRLWEVRYDDWEKVVVKMTGDVVIRNADDPLTKLLMGETSA